MTNVKMIFLLSITFADQQLDVGAGTEWTCQQVLFYSVRCQHISKINKARKNRKNYMVGELTPAFGKGWEMHSDIKSLYFISCVLFCIHRVGSCISDQRLSQSGESRWKFGFWQISTFPHGIISLRVNKALGVVSPHTDTSWPILCYWTPLFCVHQHCLLPLGRGNQVWWWYYYWCYDYYSWKNSQLLFGF